MFCLIAHIGTASPLFRLTLDIFFLNIKCRTIIMMIIFLVWVSPQTSPFGLEGNPLVKIIQRQKVLTFQDTIGTSNRDFKSYDWLSCVHTHRKDRINNNTLKPFNSTYLHCGGLTGLIWQILEEQSLYQIERDNFQGLSLVLRLINLTLNVCNM